MTDTVLALTYERGITMGHDTMPDGNKIQVCQVGDLVPGQTFRTPARHTLMVLDLSTDDGYSTVATETGGVFRVSNSIRLGRDRAGRLYASCYLNRPEYAAATICSETTKLPEIPF